jgi:predicted acylesterase/phospholipase RssA
MADARKITDGPLPTSAAGFDFAQLPDYDNDFTDDLGIAEFAKALAAPENSPSQEDLLSPHYVPREALFITALNDWRPVRQKVRRRKRRKPQRGKDETREGFVYGLLKWPLLFFVFGWIIFLGVSYLYTRMYIWAYEQWVTWRGKRERLRKQLRSQQSYQDWVEAAEELDAHLGNDKWKREDEYAYYDCKTIKSVTEHMRNYREQAEAEEKSPSVSGMLSEHGPIDELRGLVEACVKNNFAGFENSRLYSETYYGTKDLVQSFVDEVEASLSLLNRTKQLDVESKRALFKHIHTNFGRSALCLSGGATFAYYHFGVAKALLDADLLPEVITGTSGGAVVAALLATRTNDELKKLLVPALANRITACHDDFTTWVRRWWKTGARFDSVDWARRCSWFTRGSMTFREAYQRTGRILNVSCVPSDPHSPTILANYLTSPDCVIWSAVLASAAVPGILNPVVLMKKSKDGTLEPYSFGHKWKDGSLRTDIPLKALNLHFNVNFSIVSQVNPHVNLFFFSSRGTVGRPVTHRRGRGWRGGFLGSATEQYLKLDLTKWLKVLRHLELLPRPLGQDWSNIWLQRFNGTITIWPKSIPSDFYYILSDPTPQRLANMIRVGQLSTWPKLKFIANRMKIERLIEAGRKSTRPRPADGITQVLSEDDLRGLLREVERNNGFVAPRPFSASESSDSEDEAMQMPSNATANKPLPKLPHADQQGRGGAESPNLSTRLSNWWNRSKVSLIEKERPTSMYEMRPKQSRRLYEQVSRQHRRESLVAELERQSRVFFDDEDFDAEDSGDGEGEEGRNGANGEHVGGQDEYESVFDSEEAEDDERMDDPAERAREERALQREERSTVVG